MWSSALRSGIQPDVVHARNALPPPALNGLGTPTIQGVTSSMLFSQHVWKPMFHSTIQPHIDLYKTALAFSGPRRGYGLPPFQQIILHSVQSWSSVVLPTIQEYTMVILSLEMYLKCVPACDFWISITWGGKSSILLQKKWPYLSIPIKV